MRVFYLGDSLNTGGTEHQMVEAARRLRARNHEIMVGCLLAQGPFLNVLQEAKIPVLEFSPCGNLLGPTGIRQMVRLAWFLRRERFDVVHTHDLYSNLLGIPAAWLARVPRIISSRRDLASWWWYTPRNRKILRWIQTLGHLVVANSFGVRDFLVNEDGFRAAKIRVIRNAVDCERFAGIKADRQKLFPNCGTRKLVITVGNMHDARTKGHTYLIEAAAKICREAPETTFVLVGDGQQRPSLEQLVERQGLGAHFLFLGARKDVPELLMCCDLAVLASVAEGLPNVVLEYLAAGLPVVATRVGGVPEIIEDDYSGLLVPPRDSEALATAVLQLLRAPAKAKQLASAGQEWVHRHFSYDRLLAELEDVYSMTPPPAAERTSENPKSVA